MLFYRNCPQCNRELCYINEVSFKKQVLKQGLCRSCSTTKYANKQNDLSVLLNESLVTYYWLGFILADGSFKNKKRIIITISNNDLEHLKKLQNYLSIKNIKLGEKYSNINAMDSIIVHKLCDKFDIKSNKTENPPNIDVFKNLEYDKLMSLIIGFIDGDGNIIKQYKRKDWLIRIKLHHSWLMFLKLISVFVLEKDLSKITNQGYSQLVMSNTNKTKILKEFGILNKLPFLERKWDVIDLDYITNRKK